MRFFLQHKSGQEIEIISFGSNVSILSIGVNEKNKYRADLIPRRTCFAPRRINDRYELSSFSIDNLSDSDAWKLLNTNISCRNGNQIPARIDFDTDFVKKHQLKLDINWTPDRHVNLIDWPDDEAARINKSQILAANSKVILAPA